MKFRVVLTGDQMHIIKMAVHDAARWYVQYGGCEHDGCSGDAWFAQRAKENQELSEYLDRQIPSEPNQDEP